ncbi:MAG: MATE family efflux transporter [Oscillospiraceae bacterium]|nr:MATE family efflux transporter [Oscillospiraceae bacterium]
MELMYTKKELVKQMFKIGIPVAAQNFVSVLVNMLDTIMIGSVGEAQLGAINQVNSLYLFFNMFVWGISMGTVVITARYWGQQKIDPIRDMIGLAMKINVSAGILLSAVTITVPHVVMRIFASDPEVIAYGIEYLRIMGWFYVLPAISTTFLSNLRAIHDVKISVVVYTTACLTNLVLNWVLIYGNLGAPRLEVAGAAIATAISKTVEFALVLIYMYKFEHRLNFRMHYIFAKTKQYVPSFIKFGIPVFFSEFIWGFGMTMQSAILGQYSKEFLAAYSLVLVILDLSTVAMCGFSNSSLILMGNMIGAGRDQEAKKWSRFFVLGGLGVGVFMATIVMIIRPFAPGFIVCSETTANYILSMLLVCAYIDVCYGMSWNLGAGVLRAGGDTNFVAKIDVGSAIFMKGVVGAICGLLLKLDPLLVMAIVCSDEFLKAVIFMIKYLKGDWLRHGMTVHQEEPETV